MSETVLTVDPTVVDAALVDGRGRMDVHATDVHAHLSRPVDPDSDASHSIATLAIETPASDLPVAVELTRADVGVLAASFHSITGGAPDGA